MKLPTFKGVGYEDTYMFWFVADPLCTAKNVNIDDVKREQLDMVVEGRALDWFMGYLAQNVDPTIVQIKDDLKQKFRKKNSYSQCVIELKDIKQEPEESVWEAYQWMKQTISEGGFVYDDKKQKEWFISMLLPHLCGPMSQQKIDSQAKTLEVSMTLEVAPRVDDQFKMLQIQSQLEVMHL